uniref:hypothetical protein n=1 Tax=Rheinheimera sp. TaxID=1869214 RepID=UPI0040477AF1
MNDDISLAEIRNDNDRLRAYLSPWKEKELELTASFPKGVNFFLAECYFRFGAVENEPLLLALLSESTTIEALTGRQFCQPTAVSGIIGADVGEIRFRFVAQSYPFLFAERVLAPLCRDPETALFTSFVNAKKKGFAEKHICRDQPPFFDSISEGDLGLLRSPPSRALPSGLVFYMGQLWMQSNTLDILVACCVAMVRSSPELRLHYLS